MKENQNCENIVPHPFQREDNNFCLPIGTGIGVQLIRKDIEGGDWVGVHVIKNTFQEPLYHLQEIFIYVHVDPIMSKSCLFYQKEPIHIQILKFNIGI